MTHQIVASLLIPTVALALALVGRKFRLAAYMVAILAAQVVVCIATGAIRLPL